MDTFKTNKRVSEDFIDSLEVVRTIFLNHTKKLLVGSTKFISELLAYESRVLLSMCIMRRDAISFCMSLDQYDFSCDEFALSEVRKGFDSFKMSLDIFYIYYTTLDSSIESHFCGDLKKTYEKSNDFFVSSMSDLIEEYSLILNDFEIVLKERERKSVI